jgi:hypothetical protein
MTEPIADRAYRAALQQWQGNDRRGPKPSRTDFAHLDLEPADVPDPQPGVPPLVGSVATPAPLDDTAQSILDQMHRDLRTSGSGEAGAR